MEETSSRSRSLMASSQMVRAVGGSRPAVGSSNMTILGPPTRARAMPTRRRMPPDSSIGILSMASSRLTKRSILLTSCSTSSSGRSEEHTSELQSRQYLVCRLLLEKKKKYHLYDILLC